MALRWLVMVSPFPQSSVSLIPHALSSQVGLRQIVKVQETQHHVFIPSPIDTNQRIT